MEKQTNFFIKSIASIIKVTIMNVQYKANGQGHLHFRLESLAIMVLPHIIPDSPA